MVSSIYRQTKFSTIASAVLRDHKEFQGSFTYENIRLGIVARGTKGSLQKQQKAVDENGPKRWPTPQLFRMDFGDPRRRLR